MVSVASIASSDVSSAARTRGWDGERPCRLTVLGATGSIGKNTLDLVSRSPDLFDIIALTAQSNVSALAALAIKHRAKLAVIGEVDLFEELKTALSGTGIAAAAGASGLLDAALMPADCIMAAIVGAAGLKPTFAAASQGARIALANKECLVSAGDVFTTEVHRCGAELLPVDSEHSAAFQVLAGADPDDIEKIVLTASGGPFRTWSLEALQAVTPEQALNHPNWSMGAKVSIDSATLMNKGLELIEAFHLFPVSADRLDCIVHPQSIVHSLVTYRDGSVLAQMAPPDMRTPIAVALAWPRRMSAPTEKLDLAQLGILTFEPPDLARFPALGLAKAALNRGVTAPAVLNAANEIAVAAFLDGRLPFIAIPEVVAQTIDAAEKTGFIRAAGSLDEIIAVDQAGRRLADEAIVSMAGRGHQR